MTLNIDDIFKCSCLEIMSQQKSVSSHQKDNPRDRLLDDSSDEESIDPTLKMTEEEHRGTIPGSTSATASALAGAWAQANPIVERGPPRCRKKSKIKKMTETAATQTQTAEHNK